MAKGGGSRGRPGRAGRPGRVGRPQASTGGAQNARPRKPAKRAEPLPAPTAEDIRGTFVLGLIPGATAGRWIDVWRERMPRAELDLRPIAVDTQRGQLLENDLDAAIVRLPLDREGLTVIPLYDEAPVVVVAAESHLTAADELELADLAGEIVIVARDDVLGLTVPGALSPAFAAPEDTAQAIATVAAGVGIVIVPMSLARLHQRKDTAYRPLRGAAPSTVALAWRTDATTPFVEAFVGIVRGRTANSSRG